MYNVEVLRPPLSVQPAHTLSFTDQPVIADGQVTDSIRLGIVVNIMFDHRKQFLSRFSLEKKKAFINDEVP